MIERYIGQAYYEQGQSLNLLDCLHVMQAKLNEVIDAINGVTPAPREPEALPGKIDLTDYMADG